MTASKSIMKHGNDELMLIVKEERSLWFRRGKEEPDEGRCSRRKEEGK